jgi:hypothetical protein
MFEYLVFRVERSLTRIEHSICRCRHRARIGVLPADTDVLSSQTVDIMLCYGNVPPTADSVSRIGPIISRYLLWRAVVYEHRCCAGEYIVRVACSRPARRVIDRGRSLTWTFTGRNRGSRWPRVWLTATWTDTSAQRRPSKRPAGPGWTSSTPVPRTAGPGREREHPGQR